MERNDYLKMLVEEMHSTTMATIGADGHPQTRVIDMMLWDKKGVYFLTAKGKAFYAQLMEQGYVAISARSHSKVNVQRIMEEMGGGGHFNLAAAQVYDQTIEEVCETLTTIIREEIKDS